MIVTGDPLQNITAAREVRTVMKDGHLYDPKTLLDAAVNKIGPSGPAEDQAWSLYHRIRPFGAGTPE